MIDWKEIRSDELYLPAFGTQVLLRRKATAYSGSIVYIAARREQLYARDMRSLGWKWFPTTGSSKITKKHLTHYAYITEPEQAT